MSKAGEGKIGFWAVVAIGVGGMVGGGIFAVLGLAVQLAHGGTPWPLRWRAWWRC